MPTPEAVRLIGDLPFFVSPDSSDVWANPELFLLDEQHRPRFVAGVPPDYFSSQGQLWGNPVYDWEALRRTGYRWCIDRLRALLAHVDADSAGSFPRLRGRLACARRRADGPVGPMGAGPGRRVLQRGPERARRSAVHRRGPGSDHARRLMPSATSSTCPGRGSSSSPSTAIPITPISPTTTSPTRWCTPAPTTITRRAAGSRNCRMTSGRTCGVI